MPTSALPEEEMKLAMDMLESNVSAAAVRRVLHQRGNGNLSDDQIQNIRKLAERTKGEEREAEGARTPAENILRYLEKNNISHVALYDEPESQLLTIMKPRADNLRKQRASDQRQYPGGKVKIVTRLRSGDDAFETHAQDVDIASFIDADSKDPGKNKLDDFRRRERARLLINGNGRKKLLLAVAWSTDSMRAMFAKFPETMAGDITFQTNSERRPLWNFSGKTSSNKTYTALCAFLPSQARWCFDWVYRFALPAILPREALNRITLFITDGDDKLYDPYIELISQLFPNARHALCVWHLIDRGLRRKLSTRNSSAEWERVYLEMTTWLYSWSQEVESDDEFRVSFSLFSLWLERPSTVEALTPANICALRDYIQVSMLPLREKWLQNEQRHSCRSFDQRTSNIVESEHAAMTTSSLGPRPCFPINRSCKVLSDFHDSRLADKKKASAVALDQLPTKGCIPGLHGEVVQYAADLAIAQYDARGNYVMLRVHTSTFYVLLHVLPNAGEDIVIPRFWRTRVVRIVEVDEKAFLVCSCNLHKRLGITCRHIYAILDRVPDSADVIVRWHKLFAFFYFEDSVFTQLYRDAERDEPPGTVLTEKELATLTGFEIATEEEMKEYLPQLPGQSAVLRPYSFWASDPCGASVVNVAQRAGETAASTIILSGLAQDVRLSTAVELEGYEVRFAEPPTVLTPNQRRGHIRVLLSDLMPAIEKMSMANVESYEDVSSTVRGLYDRLIISSRITVPTELEAPQQRETEGWASSNHETERARVAKRLRPFNSPTRK